MCAFSFAQRHAHTWMFGSGLKLDFNCEPPRIVATGGALMSNGSASISDACGDLRFYTNGNDMWHFTHFQYQDTVFPLNGSANATQSSLILPSKSIADKYYLFTVTDTTLSPLGLSYTEIENAGATAPGTFPSGKANKILSVDINEMITATDHANGDDYWVVVKRRGDFEFRAYFVSEQDGVDTNYVPSLAGVNTEESGQMKMSPDGKYLVIAKPLQIFTFDNATGKIEDYLDFTDMLYIDEGKRESIAFSPSGEKLFFCNYGFSGLQYGNNNIWQIDLTQTDFEVLKSTIVSGTPSFEPTGSMQLGPDGKIYVIETPGSLALTVINSPELVGTDMDLVRNALPIPFLSTNPPPSAPPSPGTYFPTFNQSYFYGRKPFNTSFVCSNDSTLFEINPDGWIDEIDGAKIDSVEWDFGDGTSSKKEAPKHKFPTHGCYTITSKIYSAGTDYIKEKQIRINQAPTLEFGSRDTSLCSRPRLLTLFASSADNPGASHNWYYDTAIYTNPVDDEVNPRQSFENYPWHKADREGTYWVRKEWECCTAWDTITIKWDSMVPRFIVNDNLQCLEDNDFIFTNTSVPSIKAGATKWDFGPGGKKSGEIAKVKFYQNGAYYPTMTAESEKGCKGKLTRIVLVVKHPVARFFIDTNEQCFNGNVFSIRDSSTIEFGQGGLQKWDFDLGDSTKTTLKKFTKKYTEPGEYDIRLIISSSQDCRDTLTKSVRIYDQPNAGFMIDDTSQCLSANDFNFIDTSTSPLDSINLRHWTYGDGSPLDDRTNLPRSFNRNYNSVDSFLVRLEVSTGIGCADTAKKYVYVHGDPFVDFSINDVEQCVDGNLYNFTDTTFTEKGFVQTKIWDFGDGSPTANNGLNKTYSDYGAYAVKLRVITNDGCTDSVAKNVLLNPKPNAAFTIDKTISCFKDHSFIFSAAPSFIPVGTIDTYNWDFSDGTTDNVKDPQPKTFATDGAKKVVLTLVSNKGCIDSTQKVVQFYPTPVAVATTLNDDTQCLEDNLFNFTANGTTANGGTIKEYFWQLGDGTIEFGPNPPGKFYVNPDTFTILLQVTTDDNCTDTATLNVHTLPSPIANFSVDPTCLFQPSKFTNKSSSSPGFITNWNWNLGDGTETTDSVPVHTYDNTGNYTITLNVLSNYGCEAKVTKVNEAEVKPLPQARFGIEKVDFDAKNTTIQYRDSSIDANQWYWDLGKGNLSTTQNPLVFYDDTATLPVKLIISNAKGCYDTLEKSIFVAPDFFFHVPNAFTPNRDPLNPTYGGEGTLYYQEYNLKIFSRWGQKVFESNSPLDRWDGTFKGKKCIEGQYTYVYRLRDVYGFYHNYKGVLTMFR